MTRVRCVWLAAMVTSGACNVVADEYEGAPPAVTGAEAGASTSAPVVEGGVTASPDGASASNTDSGTNADAAAAGEAGTDASVADASGATPDASKPDASTPFDAAVPVGSYAINFATAAIENPLSMGGLWSNNTQGVGGNVAPLDFTSMRTGVASDGVTTIAYATHAGINYDDSFAFVPGFAGDQYIEAMIYKEPGYNPNASSSNHEIELLLGCSSASGTRTWNEFLYNAGGGIDILYLTDGPTGFTNIANVGGAGGKVPEDGDVIRATKVGDVLSFYINGVFVLGYNGANPNHVARGSGIGIAGFIRPGATHNKFGFRSVKLGPL